MAERIARWQRKELATIILERLEKEKERLRKEFTLPGRINSCYIDDLLPADMATTIYEAFPEPAVMAIHRSIRENKRVAAQMDLYDPLLEEIVFAFQDERIVRICEYITGLREMKPDEWLYAGGISLMSDGNFLHPHLDNSHDNDREHYRVLNLLYYVSPGWKEENGGNLELWDRGMKQKPRTIVSGFNRLALMITNKSSYHSVSKVTVNAKRCCVSNYYFSKQPAENEAYFHVTSFFGRPGELTRGIALKIDRHLRNFIRKVHGRSIVGTRHIYKKEQKKK